MAVLLLLVQYRRRHHLVSRHMSESLGVAELLLCSFSLTSHRSRELHKDISQANHHTPDRSIKQFATMHLMYTMSPEGKRLYTLQKVVDGEVTKSAHPARFSPDDKYSRYA